MTALSPTITERERAAVAFHLTRSRRRELATMREEVAWLTSALSLRTAEHGALEAERAMKQAELREVQAQIIAADEEAERLRLANAEMRKSIAEERTREINQRVDTAIKTWADKKDLKTSSRSMLTHLCSTMPDEFESQFPLVESDKAFLLRSYTKSGARDPSGGALPPEPKTMSLEQIAAAIQREHPQVPYDQALERAEKLVKGAQK